MASRRTKLLASASLVVLGVGGYFLYSVFAVQGRGTLAQAPLNVQASIPPAFVMALDDSGSMRFQTLFPARDGTALWNRDGGGQPYSFFHSSGTLRAQLRGTDPTTPGANSSTSPVSAPRQGADNDNAAHSPIDEFGFSRSPAYNRAYFDPTVDYENWRYATGAEWADANPVATRVNPNTATPTVNLTVESTVATSALADDHRFRIRTGMVLPSGMKYSGTTSCGLSNGNSSASTPAGWRTLNTDVTASWDTNAYIAYFPATYYLPTAQAAPAGFIAANRVLIVNACSYRGATGTDRCDLYKYEIRPANYSTSAAYQSAIVNFANWFSYYGARNRSIVSAITNSLIGINNMRVGYFTINNRVNAVMRDMQTQKDAFYGDIVTLGASGNTPNLPAVDFLGKQFQRRGAGAPIELACQKNGGMLFTDGLSNVDGPNVGNTDGGMGVPFADAYSDTLADIATKYYLDAPGGVSPLNTLDFAAGQVPIPEACGTFPVGSIEWKRLDCQRNLHMNFYGVTLGARGEIFDGDVDRDPFVAPHPAWPPFDSGERSTVDDIWHAAVNTRGEFINARTPEEITLAMRRVLQSFAAGASPSGSIAVTGSRIGAGTLTVSPFYEARNEGTDWYSRLTAQTAATNPVTGVVTFTDAWEASTRLPSAASRGSTVWFDNGGTTRQFTAGNVSTLATLCNNPEAGMSLCTGPQLAALGPSLTVSQAVAYLLGDQSMEVERSPTGKLRFRTTRLGDIVGSTPIVSSPKDDYGYRGLPSPYGAAYGTYLTNKGSTRRPMVYAGANDGMLHGFDGRADSSGGIERFAYIPQGVSGHLGNLLFPYVAADGGDQKFQHRYFVDGPVTVSDAYYGGSWKTTLVASTGAGARGVFALNTSGVSGLSGSFAASDRLWDVNALNTSLTTAVRNNLGYVLGRPVIVPIKTGSGTGPVKWRAIFGNGYNSVSGKAVLFLVDIATGTPNITMIEANEAGAGVPPGTNGLGNIVVTDRWGPAADSTLTLRVRDGFADTVYAADQKGAIWKFDLRDAAPANLTTPVFTTLKYTAGPEAGTRQPIIGGLTTAAGPRGGVLIFFGTGSFSFNGDARTRHSSPLCRARHNSGTTIPVARSSSRRYRLRRPGTYDQLQPAEQYRAGLVP